MPGCSAWGDQSLIGTVWAKKIARTKSWVRRGCEPRIPVYFFSNMTARILRTHLWFKPSVVNLIWVYSEHKRCKIECVCVCQREREREREREWIVFESNAKQEGNQRLRGHQWKDGTKIRWPCRLVIYTSLSLSLTCTRTHTHTHTHAHTHVHTHTHTRKNLASSANLLSVAASGEAGWWWMLRYQCFLF